MKPTHGSNRKFYFIASDILIDENALWPSIEYSMEYASVEYMLFPNVDHLHLTKPC